MKSTKEKNPTKETDYSRHLEKGRINFQYEIGENGLRKILVSLIYDPHGEPHTNILFILDPCNNESKSELERKVENVKKKENLKEIVVSNGHITLLKNTIKVAYNNGRIQYYDRYDSMGRSKYTVQEEINENGLRKILVPLIYDGDGEPHTNPFFAFDPAVYTSKGELEKKIK